MMGFEIPSLHVRSLGVPLIYEKLTAQDCQVLSENCCTKFMVGLKRNYLMGFGYNWLNQFFLA